MHSRPWRFTLAVVLLSRAAAADAQPLAQGLPTTVQLPTFSFFSVNTTVSIPDSGGAYSEAARLARMGPSPGLKPAGSNLGAVNSLRAGQGGAALVGGNVAASATLIPPIGPAESLTPDQDAHAFAAQLQRAQTSSAEHPGTSLAQARQAYAARQQAAERAAMQLIQQGDDALARGNRAAAKIYYQNAARRGAQLARDEALARLHLLTASPPR